MLMARGMVLTTLTLLMLALSSAPVQAGDNPEIGCVNVTYANIGTGISVFVTLNNVIGFGIESDDPGDGFGAGVFIAPSLCTTGSSGEPSSESTAMLSALDGAATALPLP